MDLLGSRKILAKPSKEAFLIKDIIDHFTSLARNFEIDHEITIEHTGERHQFHTYTPEISNFSDHIVASYPAENFHPPFDSPSVRIYSLIKIAAQFHRVALEQGFLMRGAIVQGGLWHKGNSILGPALIEAVELEETIACYPRVIFQEPLISLLKENVPDLTTLYIERDFDGVYFFNYTKHFDFVGVGSQLRAPLLAIKQQISNKLEHEDIQKNIKILTKWRWLANKFNVALDYFHERENSLGIIDKINL